MLAADRVDRLNEMVDNGPLEIIEEVRLALYGQEPETVGSFKDTFGFPHFQSPLAGRIKTVILTRKPYAKRGYEVRNELWSLSGDVQPTKMTSAYSLADGNYLGNDKEAYRMWKKFGITQWEKTEPEHCVCSIGFSPREQKWYGWSHRAIFGFGIGSKSKKGHIGYSSLGPGFVAKNLEDACRMATAFAKEVS